MTESLVNRKLPPITEIGAAAMVAVAVGVIFNAAYLPKHAPTAVAVAILIVAAALEATNLFLVSRIQDFAWSRFKQVAAWFLVAYAVIAGMIEYAFVYDDTRGTQLVILTLMLVLFMLNVPVLAAFTVARYERV
ncbi:MAG TPA: hypothetical protein VLJ44_02395 [Gaiellaceae bacterium]|nr:hypothetical protein [Gaiellaceae bacterium]